MSTGQFALCDCSYEVINISIYIYLSITMAPGGSVAPGGGSSNASYCALDADHTMCQYPVGGALELLYTCDCLIAIVLQGPSAECSAKTSFRELSAAAKAAILERHNELRRRVAKGEEDGGINPPQPQAANMRKLVRGGGGGGCGCPLCYCAGVE